MIDWKKNAEQLAKDNPIFELEDPRRLSEEDKQFLHGAHNGGIRYYYYLEHGLNILNEFRNLFLGILAIYIALKLTNPLLMVAMFVPCLLVLTIVGYYNVHKLNKVKEWLGMRYSTYYGIKNFNFQQGQYQMLKEIKELLEHTKLNK